jgi:hypothetical protein
LHSYVSIVWARIQREAIIYIKPTQNTFETIFLNIPEEEKDCINFVVIDWCLDCLIIGWVLQSFYEKDYFEQNLTFGSET